LLIVQHSDPQSIIGSIKTLYRWSLVLFVIRDLHKCGVMIFETWLFVYIDAVGWAAGRASGL